MAASHLVQGLIDNLESQQESKSNEEMINENKQFNLVTQVNLEKFKRIAIIGYDVLYLFTSRL